MVNKLINCKSSKMYKKKRKITFFSKLWDNCIQNFHLGRYIVGYTVGNLVLRRRVSHIKFSLKTTVKIYFVVPIRPAAASCIKPLAAAFIHLSANEKRRYVMTSGFRQYIAGYTVANL